jgi:membrane-associated protease RseP (regulator of RpoE activity)
VNDDDDDKTPVVTRQPRLLLHAALFLATVLTTTAAGALQLHLQRPGGGGIAPISDGLSYSIPLLLILVAHEAGHFLVARLHGVPASLPFFIPLPPGLGLGTMGAVISQNVTRDRKRLIDIGAAGPLAGLLVTIPVIWYGLRHSQVLPLVAGGQQEGNSLLYALLKRLATGAWLPDGQRDVFLHPTAFAGWAGLLITMINLIPIGQLDGGHIAVAYFGNGWSRVAQRLHKLLPLLAIAVALWVWREVTIEAAQGTWERALLWSIAIGAAFPWLVWYLMVGLLRRASGGVNHPPVDDTPLPASRKLLFWLVVVVFIAVFMPVVSRTTLAGIQPPPEPPAKLSLAP